MSDTEIDSKKRYNFIKVNEESYSGGLICLGLNNFGQIPENILDIKIGDKVPNFILYPDDSEDETDEDETAEEKQQKIKDLKNSIGDWLDISAGLYHTAAITREGALYTSGLGNFGQTGFRNPLAIGDFTLCSNQVWRKVGCGDFFTIVQDGNNNCLYSFGKNDVGQLGNGKTFNNYSPTLFLNADIRDFSCGSDFCGAIDKDKNLYVWGSNSYGQLGLGSKKNYLTPMRVNGSWLKFAAGCFHSLAIRSSDSSLCGTGLNNYGQLGLSDKIYRNWTTIDNSRCWRRVSCGTYHSAAIDSDGNLFMSGYNLHGQLGTGDQENKNKFIGTDGQKLDNVEKDEVKFRYTHVSAIGYMTLALGGEYKEDEKAYGNKDLYFFGDNTFNIINGGDNYILSPYKLEIQAGDICRNSYSGIIIVGISGSAYTDPKIIDEFDEFEDVS